MSLRYRRLDANHDYTFGQGRGNYLTDVDAVAQAILTRLLLFLGEWWEDTQDGLPMWQSFLGAPATQSKKEARDRLIQERILGTEGVENIEDFSSTQSSETGKYEVAVVVNTVYGQVVVTNQGNITT